MAMKRQEHSLNPFTSRHIKLHRVDSPVTIAVIETLPIFVAIADNIPNPTCPHLRGSYASITPIITTFILIPQRQRRH